MGTAYSKLSKSVYKVSGRSRIAARDCLTVNPKVAFALESIWREPDERRRGRHGRANSGHLGDSGSQRHLSVLSVSLEMQESHSATRGYFLTSLNA